MGKSFHRDEEFIQRSQKGASTNSEVIEGAGEHNVCWDQVLEFKSELRAHAQKERIKNSKVSCLAVIRSSACDTLCTTTVS